MLGAQGKCPASVWGPQQSQETFSPVAVEDSCADSVSSVRVRMWLYSLASRYTWH